MLKEGWSQFSESQKFSKFCFESLDFGAKQKKGVETKKTGTVRLPAEQLATQLHVRASLMWVQGFMVWEDLDPFDKKELNHLATPVGKKNTHQNRRSQKYNH